MNYYIPSSAPYHDAITTEPNDMSTVLYLARISDVKDDDGHHLSHSVLIAIIVVFLLFVLLILGFTLVWCSRSQGHDTAISATTTADFFGTTPISRPQPVWIPLRVYHPRHDRPELRNSVV